MVDDGLTDREVGDLRHSIVPHGVVHQEQAIASLDPLEVVVIPYERANLGLRFPGEELAPCA